MFNFIKIFFLVYLTSLSIEATFDIVPYSVALSESKSDGFWHKFSIINSITTDKVRDIIHRFYKKKYINLARNVLFFNSSTSNSL